MGNFLLCSILLGNVLVSILLSYPNKCFLQLSQVNNTMTILLDVLTAHTYLGLLALKS